MQTETQTSWPVIQTPEQMNPASQAVATDQAAAFLPGVALMPASTSQSGR
jgi:hypothetical protein